MAGVFGRPVTLIRLGYTYGAVADFLLAMLQRLLLPFCVLPSRGVDALCSQVRHALVTSSADSLKSSSSHEHTHEQQQQRRRRVIVLAHNTGATAVSQALVRLASDVPAARMAQLEVYTFGSMAPDFVLPGNSQDGKAGGGGDMTTDRGMVALCQVEHVAHAQDPCARFGVLRSVQEDLAGKYCGGVFVLGGGSSGGGVGGSISNSGGGIGLGLTLGRSVGYRQTSRGRSFSPPLALTLSSSSNSINNNAKTRQNRMSFPFTYQQQQQYQHQQQQHYHHGSQLVRRSISASSSLTSDSISSSSSTTSTRPGRSNPLSLPKKIMLSMEDYLTALFGPEPWSMRPDMDGDGTLSSDAYFLNAAICVDRELAEKREVAAMALAGGGGTGSSPSSVNGRLRGRRADGGFAKSMSVSKNEHRHHRLSWTGLGATAKYGTTKGASSIGTKNSKPTKHKRAADANGLLGLETVRRLCKECDGRPGRDVSLLAGYFSEAVVRHRERFGF